MLTFYGLLYIIYINNFVALLNVSAIVLLYHKPGDLPGLKKDLQVDSVRLIWGEHVMKKGPLIAFLDNSLQKLEFTAWFAVNVTFGSKNNVFYHWWPHCAPTPLGLIGLRYKLSAHMQKFRLLFRKLSESLTFQNVLKFKFCLQLSDLKLFGPRILFWTIFFLVQNYLWTEIYFWH